MSSRDCTLSITVARTDLPFLRQTIPHLVRSCRHRFVRRVLVMDTRPLAGKFRRRPGAGSVEELVRACEELQQGGVVTDVVAVDHSEGFLARHWRPLFDEPVTETTDFRGCPSINYVFSLAEARTRYLVHFDSDMMLHQSPAGRSWIDRGIDLLEANADLCTVLPLSGPPHPDGPRGQAEPFIVDARGFYRFDHFTARVFLVDRTRVDGLLPLSPRWRRGTTLLRRIGNLRRTIAGRSAMPTLEMMLTDRMRQKRLWRADLATESAWSLHPDTRSPQFFAALDRIIAGVEAGVFPPAQAGRYDLALEAWT